MIAARARAALASGALEPIETDETALEDGDVRFVVRSVTSLARKRAAGAIPKDDARPNPFAPPDAELVIGDITPTHFGVLNKYPVVAHHLLIVTREFVDQVTLLDATDFAALAACLRQVDGLGFYNGGREAGASQPHRHLQLVPLPARRAGGAPGACRWRRCSTSGRAAAALRGLLRLPFRNAFAVLEPSLFDDVDAAARLLERYDLMLAACGLARRVGERQRPRGERARAPARALQPPRHAALDAARAAHAGTLRRDLGQCAGIRRVALRA